MSFRQDANRLKNLPPKRTHAIDGCKITYTVAGQGTPTIVLINGVGGLVEVSVQNAGQSLCSRQ